MSFRYLLTVCILSVCAVSMAYSQNGFSPPAVNLPWNDYRPSRIDNEFETIIGDAKTKMLSRTDNVGWRDLEEDTIHLPFDFNFIRTLYPAGTPLVVSQRGYISFGRANSNPRPTRFQWFTLPYFLQYSTSSSRGYFNKVIAPYWSNLETAGVNSENGAVYYKILGAAPSGNRRLIVEWRARSGNSPRGGAPGNFQAILSEKNHSIEFHYGDNSIRKNNAGWGAEGAVVGLKNWGQRDLGRAPGPDEFNSDEDNFLLLIHPNQNMAHYPALGDDTVAITRVRTMNNWWFGENYPEYDANDFSDLAPPNPRQARASPYFHYSFPNEFDNPIAYKIVPILNDIACDSVWFFPSAKANAYPKEAEFTVSARFQNRGANVQNNTPVRMDIIRNGIELAFSDTKFVAPGQRLGTDETSFDKVLKTITTRTGLYEVQIYPQLPGEEDFRNDTCKIPVFIQGQRDIMSLQILQPLSNVPPLFNKYPVGVGVQIEARYLNIGLLQAVDPQVGFSIYDANGDEIYKDVTIIEGIWPSLEFRDRLLPAWTPQQPGDFFIRTYTLMKDDEQILNDTVPNWRFPGKQFSVRYEIEVSVSGNVLPPPNTRWPLGKEIPVQATFVNNGLSDATNTPAQVVITDPAGVVVYDRTVTVLDIVAEGGAPTIQDFPRFIPSSGPGQYCATVKATNAQDPVVTNNEISWCFEVAPHLSGQIFVGFGERFETIQEAKDSLYFYGVSGPLEFILVDDQYTVETGNNDPSQPALDFRGEVVGLGPNAPVTWMPHPNKTEVKVHMKSPSGIGFWYGQIDTINPDGYITWDGGARRALRFQFENTGLRDLAAPFFFGRGASNYAVRNSTIEPLNSQEGYKSTKTISVPEYDQSFNSFLFLDDLGLQTSAGIMLRNSMPIDPVTGNNLFNADSLRNQDNVFEGNHIRNFAYGVLSIGAGPVYDIGLGGYVAYNNQSNTYRNNMIEQVGRAGIAVAYETGSHIVDNTIRTVNNNTADATRKGGAETQATDEPHAAGIWVSAGGNGTPADDRGYSTDLSIERNTVSDIRTSSGAAVGIWVETNENELVTPANIVFRFPQSGVSNISVRNNMAWDYSGPDMSAGIGVAAPEGVRGSYIARNNRVENNTVYNANLSKSSREVGIGVDGSGGVIHNNIIAVMSGNSPVGLGIVAHDERGGSRAMRDLAVSSDYNLFWVPNGAVGSLEILSPEGFALPSPPAAVTVEQWRFRTGGLDENSVQGNVTNEFVSTTPGSVDLHIDPLMLGALTSNRGMKIDGLTEDIDNQPRGGAATRGRYDIGADEFVGQMRNNDVTPVAVIGPTGYQAVSGQFSDAEYMMVGRDVDVTAQIRNIGGRPVLSNMVQVDVEYWTGTGWVNSQSWTQSASVDVAEAADVTAGSFQPQTLAETGVNDPFYGMDANVTPIYRFRVTTGLDDNLGNNVYEKRTRFYVQRSDRRVLVSVEDYDAVPDAYPADVTDLGNKLNADALLSALAYMRWERSDATPAGNDFDLFERDRWPQYALDFTPWQTTIWSQGEDAEGILPEERWAMKELLDGYNTYNRAGLIIAGQEVARLHDVALNGGNGQVADKEFVNEYLRAAYLRATDPAVYEGRIQGIRITPGRYDLVKATGVANDLDPMPGVVAATLGEGIAQGSHWYVDQTPGSVDSLSGTTISNYGNGYNVVHYAIDWRHFGRFDPDAEKSGINRVVLGAIDFLDQYGSVLPVELTSFNAYQSSREAVTVEWATASEVEVSAMEIERAEVVKSESGESVGDYRSIDRQTPKGDVTRGADYRTVDGSVRMGGEYNYRLVVVDMDGSRTVDQSARVKVRGGAAGYELAVQPNPMRSQGVITYSVPSGERVRVTLYDVNGKVVLDRDLSESTGSVSVPVSELSSGSYNVVLETTSGERLSETITISK